MGLKRGLQSGLKTLTGGLQADVTAPTVTILTYPTDPTDDTTPTFTFEASEPGCTFEYKIDAGSYTACTSPLTLDAQTDGTYTIYIRATDPSGNTGGPDSYSWTLETAYAGSLPSTVGAMNGWSLASPWTILHNYSSATVGPSACNSATGSETLNLIKLGSDTTATLTAAPQSNYATQGGYTVNTNQDSLYAAASALWKFSATVPTAYLVTCKFAGTPTSGTIFFGGSDGSTGGWYLEAHATSGIRAAIGNGTSGFVATSYVGGTSFYDGEYHTLLLVVDDANGKAKLYSEFANTESTGLTIASNDAFCTVGPAAAGDTWGTAVTYLITARGEHPLLYTNAQSLFDEYEDARLNNVNQTAIAGLPTTLTEVNDALGTITLTNAYNLNSATPSPMTGSAGPSLAAYTGAMAGFGSGTAPTVSAAPQVRASFTSQACIAIDSNGDNLQGTSAMPETAHTGILVFKSPNGTHPGTSQDMLGIQASTAGSRPWAIRSNATNVVQIESYDSYSGTVRAANAISTGVANDGLWHIAAWRRDNSGGTNRIEVSTAASTAAGSSGTTTQSPSALTQEGGLGRIYQNPFGTNPLQCSMALFGWGTALATNANITDAINAFRWRYGI